MCHSRSWLRTSAARRRSSAPWVGAVLGAGNSYRRARAGTFTPGRTAVAHRSGQRPGIDPDTSQMPGRLRGVIISFVL